MPPSRRAVAATADLTTTPPITLPVNHYIARVTKAAGNNLYYVEYPPSSSPTTSSPAQPEPSSITQTSTAPAQPNTLLFETRTTHTALIQLHPRFRNTIYLKRGSFVVVDTAALAERENKLGGEIVNVVREERAWRKMGWWPVEWGRVGVGRGAGGEVDLLGVDSGSDGEGEVEGKDEVEAVDGRGDRV